MNILSIDTVGLKSNEFSITLKTEKVCVTKRYHFFARQQAEMLIPMLDSVLSEASIAKGEIDTVLVAEGPGSFTGLRLAYATAKAISYAVGAKVFAIPTLACLAQTLSPCESEIFVIVDAKRNSVYGQIFNGESPVTTVEDKAIKDFLPNLRTKTPILLCVGYENIKNELENTLKIENCVIIEYKGVFSLNMVEYFLINKSNLLALDENAGPVYVRKSDAEQNLCH